MRVGTVKIVIHKEEESGKGQKKKKKACWRSKCNDCWINDSAGYVY